MTAYCGNTILNPIQSSKMYEFVLGWTGICWFIRMDERTSHTNKSTILTRVIFYLKLGIDL